MNNHITVTQTQWQLHTFLVNNGGTCTIAEATSCLGRSWGAAESALREMYYKGIVSYEKKHFKTSTPARFTLVKNKSVVYFPKEEGELHQLSYTYS